MTETFAHAVERMHGLIGRQVEGWRQLLESTRRANEAAGEFDVETFDDALAEQVETLRELRRLQAQRDAMVRDVGPPPEDDGLRGLEAELRALASEVGQANRTARLVIERNGALVEARLALHRRAGRNLRPAGVDRVA